jgi:ketosteroid isomerase-like protein
MKIYTVATTSTLIACASFAGCGKTDEGLPVSVTTAVSRDFNQGDPLKTAAHYTDDAQILPPRHPVIEGKAAITAFFESNIDKYIAFGNDTTWSAVHGDIGIEQGTYNVRNVRWGVDAETGKYIRVWKRINGSWKLYRDMFSPDSALAESVYVSPEEGMPAPNPVADSSGVKP